MINRIKEKKQYHLLYLLTAFVIFVAAWFTWRVPGEQASNWTQNPALAETSQGSESEFEPDGSNVSPSTQSQLEALRLRVVESPGDTTHLFRLARMLQDAHKPGEAARNYRHYLALHPDNYQAWLDMTQSFGQAQKWGDAHDAVDDMLERYPEDPSALYNLGAVYANLGKMEEAKSTWEKVVEQDKDPDVILLAKSSIQRLIVN